MRRGEICHRQKHYSVEHNDVQAGAPFGAPVGANMMAFLFGMHCRVNDDAMKMIDETMPPSILLDSCE